MNSLFFVVGWMDRDVVGGKSKIRKKILLYVDYYVADSM